MSSGGATPAPPRAGPRRLESLDLIRGVAVLGILAINIAGFAGPLIGTVTPHLPQPAGLPDTAAWALGFLVFEGKMRALFSLLFGAGIVLFCESCERAGRDCDALQFRRLCWLMLFGALHYFLLWWGDILFVYGLCGIAALMLRHQSERTLLLVAFGLYGAWHLWGLLDMAPMVAAETAVRAGHASPAQQAFVSAWHRGIDSWTALEIRESRLGFLDLALAKLAGRPFWQFEMVWGVFSETLPLMLIGMVCYRRGLFDARAPRPVLATVAQACLWSGLALTALFLGWAWLHGFPPIAMRAALSWGLALPHLATGLGYAGLLALAAPWLARTAPGRCLVAAGRMAFSNYLLTSLAMTGLFYGWGLGLYGTVGPLARWLVVGLAWAAMLAWSPLWLRHFRRGPLEWAWRSLTEKALLANRIAPRKDAIAIHSH